MQLVPFNNDWADSGSKLDLKGVYQSSKPGDDRICPSLPIRRHNDWERKGLKYVTLSTLEDVAIAQNDLKARGVDLSEVKKAYELIGVGPFKVQAYLAEQPDREAAEEDQIRTRLAQLEEKKGRGSRRAQEGSGAHETVAGRKVVKAEPVA